MLRLYRRTHVGLEFLRVVALLYQARREPMLDLVLFAAFALICLYIAYERLTHRL
jgi:hypothetical protein